ncbi:fibronectin type III domain-containing protein [Streptomyces sp. NPDC059718]
MTKSTRARATALAFATTAAGLALPAGAAHAATTCSTGVWAASYYANTTFKGTPKRTACDTSINENYGTGDPAGVTLPKDNFGVRWSLTRDFGSGGPFTFTAATRDGIRVYLDGTRKIDLWKDVSTTRTKTLNLTVPKGRHTLRVDFAAFKGSANVKFTYAPRTSASVDRTKPLAPTGVKGAVGCATCLPVRISWTKNAEMDLAGYRVYRRPTGTSAWTSVSGSTLVTATARTDTPPARNGELFDYAVTAVDRAGNTSAMSVLSRVAAGDVTAPATPAGVTATGGDAGITVTWQPVPGAVRYAVKRTLDHQQETHLGTSASTTFVDTKVARTEDWTYYVAAVDAAGNTSAYTLNPDAPTTRRPPAAPVTVTATPTVGGAELTWFVPADGGNYFDFEVHHSTSLPVDTSDTPARCYVTRTRLADGRTQYRCANSGLPRGATYHYAIIGIDQTGRRSVASSPVTVTTLTRDYVPPAAVTGLTASATESGILLHWDMSTEPDIDEYAVYRGKMVDDGGRQVCSAEVLEELDWDRPGFADTQLPDGEELCYFVDAVDRYGNSGYQSTGEAPTVTVTEPDLRPAVDTPSGSPVQLNAFDSGTTVGLVWGQVADAVGYLVYRWDRGTGRYEALTPEPVTGSAWTDTAAPPATTSFYWVRAVYADGSESAPGGDYAILSP